MENWKSIEGFEDYEISNLGNVKSLKRGKETFLNPYTNQYGYKMVSLRYNNKSFQKLVHRLVYENFKEKLQSDKVIDHKNNDSTDNRLENLQQITQRENVSKDRTNKNVGVTFQDGSFVTRFTFKGKNLYLGTFDTIKEAKSEYVRALKELSETGRVTIKTPYSERKTSRYKGISFEASRNKWVATSMKSGKQVRVGRYITEQEALIALQNYERAWELTAV